jgi:hypothetical protein
LTIWFVYKKNLSSFLNITFITKSFIAGCEAFHHVHLDKEVPNKTTFRLMEILSKTGNVGNRKHIRTVPHLTHDIVHSVEETLTELPCKYLRVLSKGNVVII